MRVSAHQGLTRREAFARAVLAFAAGSIPALAPPLPANAAAYTVIPSGTIAEKQLRLKQVTKELAAANKEDRFIDPYLEGESLQLEYDIAQLEKNGEYAKMMSREVAAGTAVFPSSFRVAVPDMAQALRFWQKGAGALVLSSRLDAEGNNITYVGYGSQSFKQDDGAKFALELVQPKSGGVVPFSPESSLVQYIQLALPVFRLSQVMASGGEVVSSFGWTELTAPGGLPLRVRIDETRREPFEFVALRTSNLERAAKYYEGLGMQKVATADNSKSFKLGGSYGIYQERKGSQDAFEPDRESGAVQMGFVRNGDVTTAQQTTGLLLLPPKTRAGALAVDKAPPKLTLVGAAPSGIAPASPDGLVNSFVSLDAFEQSVSGVGVGQGSSVMDDGFEGVLSRDVNM